MSRPLYPGATLGVVGGGQLGRMFTVAARTLGYAVVVLDPDPASPAGQLANTHLKADYLDAVALMRMGTLCDAITTEFENVPARTLETLAQYCRVAPSAATLAVAQDRLLEKQHARAAGCETAPYATLDSIDDAESAWQRINGPGVLKTRRMGYDGKGQARIHSLDELQRAFTALGEAPCILEAMMPLEREISVVLARGYDGAKALFPLAENQHRNGILDISLAPARVSAHTARRARDMAAHLADELDYVGVMAVEFFVLADERIIFNEMAPRPHNSGHYTLDACVTDQFQQQVRALAGLPLGDTRQTQAAVMVNLLGDVWQPQPAWPALLGAPNLQLHLYGKEEARPGRKMGHYTCVADDLDSALASALRVRSALGAAT